MDRFTAFIEVMEELIRLFEALINIEQTKLEAAVEHKVSFVEECMNKEQAAILKLRGLDQKRENAQKELGIVGVPFREMLAQVSEEERAVLQPLFDELSEKVKQFQDVNESAKDIIEVHLHTIQSQLASREADRGTEENHNQTTKKHFTSRSV